MREVIRLSVVVAAVVLLALRAQTPVKAFPQSWYATDYYDANMNLIGQRYINCSNPVHDPWWGDSSGTPYSQGRGSCEGTGANGPIECFFWCTETSCSPC